MTADSPSVPSRRRARAALLLLPMLALALLASALHHPPAAGHPHRTPARRTAPRSGLTMAIYNAAGAGDASYNGRYTPNGNTYNGQPVYAKDPTHLLYQTSAAPSYSWAFGPVPLSGSDTSGGSAYLGPNGAASDPTGSYFANTAAGPGPTVSLVADTTAPTPLAATINAAGTGGTLNWTEADSAPVLQASGKGAAQGLTLTASGGPVTLSPVSTAGTATAFTTSRRIQQGEILTLAGAAACFTDSATAPNANAAFSGLAVSNGSTYAPAPPAAPTLTADPQLPGNVPTILLGVS